MTSYGSEATVPDTIPLPFFRLNELYVKKPNKPPQFFIEQE